MGRKTGGVCQGEIESLSRQGSSEAEVLSQSLGRDWIALSPGTESGVSSRALDDPWEDVSDGRQAKG